MRNHMLQVKPETLRIRLDVNPQPMQRLSDHAISQRQKSSSSSNSSIEVQRLPRNLHLAGDQPSGAGEGDEGGLAIGTAKADVGRQWFRLAFDEQFNKLENLSLG